MGAHIETPDGIHWYYEQHGSGPTHLVLIPSGLGDCHTFSKPMPILAAAGDFTITTFDMPGLSRSSNAPKECYTEVSPQKLARQVITLLDALKIEKACFWGTSSGGSTVLALVTDYPSKVQCAMAHEVPTYVQRELEKLLVMTDDDKLAELLSAAMTQTFLGPNLAAWQDLGEEFRQRLKKNYVTWARGYTRIVGADWKPNFPVDKQVLQKEGKDKLVWSVGGDTPMKRFVDNVVTATELGFQIALVPGLHQPYVTDHVEWAEYVIRTARTHLKG